MKAVRSLARILIYMAAVAAVSVLLIAASGAEPIAALGIFWNGIFGNKNKLATLPSAASLAIWF